MIIQEISGQLINGTILEYLSLAYVFKLFEPFTMTSAGVNAISLGAIKTYSPDDPQFTEWYEKEYKPRLQRLQSKNAGHEPEGH